MQKFLALIFFSIFLFMTACSHQPSITDEITKYDLPLFEQVENKHVIHTLYYDGMYRIGEQYKLGVGDQLVVDPHYYDNNEISRGDVVYIKLSPEERTTGRKEYDVLRIVGLSGENVRIDKGQMFINDLVLDTFYGKDNYKGEFIDGSDEGYKMSVVAIPIEHYLVATDTWRRGGVYKTPITKEQVKGKVIGWTKNK